MTFKQLQDMVLSDRFPEGKRSNAVLWLNKKYQEVLAVGAWSFLDAETPVTLNAATVALPANAGVPASILLNDYGDELDSLSVLDFRRLYLETAAPSTGRPESFAISGTNILVGPTPDTSYAATLLAHADTADLADDSSVPVLPGWTHPALAAGAAATMLKMENDPTWQPLEQEYQSTIDAMRRRYLTASSGQKRQMPRDPLAYL